MAHALRRGPVPVADLLLELLHQVLVVLAVVVVGALRQRRVNQRRQHVDQRREQVAERVNIIISLLRKSKDV